MTPLSSYLSISNLNVFRNEENILAMQRLEISIQPMRDEVLFQVTLLVVEWMDVRAKLPIPSSELVGNKTFALYF